jgi:hypothetical protein
LAREIVNMQAGSYKLSWEGTNERNLKVLSGIQEE